MGDGMACGGDMSADGACDGICRLGGGAPSMVVARPRSERDVGEMRTERLSSAGGDISAE